MYTQIQNAASDQDLHCLHTGFLSKINIKMKPEDQWSCKRSSDTCPGIYFNAFIAPGQEQTTPWEQMLMSRECPYHFAPLLQVLKQSI